MDEDMDMPDFSCLFLPLEILFGRQKAVECLVSHGDSLVFLFFGVFLGLVIRMKYFFVTQ